MIDPQHLRGIHRVSKALTLHTNAGASKTDKKGYLGEPPFWLDEHGIANVISLKTLEGKCRVSYDSKERDGAFICHTQKGQVVFTRCPITKFPCVDLRSDKSKAAAMLVQSIRQNFEGYTREEVRRAIMARKMQARAGHPSENTYKKEVSRNSESSLFKNSTLTSKDITNARRIFGPSMPCIQGKWTRGMPEIMRPD